MLLLNNQVLLLKTQSDNASDNYESYLKQHQVKVKLIKTLVFRYKNISSLAAKLAQSNDYSGIIFSSPRCVESVNLASKNQSMEEWQSKINYAVGESTAALAYETLGLKCLGKETGAASGLVDFIIKDKSKINRPLLYPHGNLKTNELSEKLERENVILDGVLTYETVENPSLEQNIKEATDNYKSMYEYVVFFSPSGIHSALKYLKNVSGFPKAKLIAIGPTTAAALVAECLPVFSVSKKPTPQNILDIIKQG